MVNVMMMMTMMKEIVMNFMMEIVWNFMTMMMEFIIMTNDGGAAAARLRSNI